MQLSAKGLIKPFDATTMEPDVDGNESAGTDDTLATDEDNVDMDEEDGGGSVGGDEAEDEEQDLEEEEDDSEDPLAELDTDDREQLLEGTAAVRTTLNKVRRDIAPTLPH